MRQELAARFIPLEKLTIDATYYYRFTMVDLPEANGVPEQQKIISRSIKGSVRYSLSENLTLSTRIDYKIVDPNSSRGMLLLQDINYKFRQFPLTLWLRYCIFRTDSWDSRLYTYENDLLYSFSIPALSGEGSRSYIMIKWDIMDIAELRLKFGQTSFSEISNSPKNSDEIKIQFRILF
jgi:hypothetical protein